MEKKQFLTLINRLLRANYQISIIDSGLSEEEWLERFGSESAENAVECYAEKYDLISKETCYFW